MSWARAAAMRRCESCGESLTELDHARCPSCGLDLRAMAEVESLGFSEALAGDPPVAPCSFSAGKPPVAPCGAVAHPGAPGPMEPFASQDEPLAARTPTVATSRIAAAYEPDLLSVPQMRYQNAYVWLVLISALDVMLTMVVLVALNGFEVNPVAAAVIETMGFPGATAFKFSVVLLVVIICEIVGRKDDQTGRNLSRAAILISALPVAYSFALIFLASNG